MDAKYKENKIVLILLGTLLITIIILILLFNPKTTTFTIGDKTTEISYLSCTLTGPSNLHPLFFDATYENVNYELKIKFINQKATNVNLIVSKEFDNSEEAIEFANKLQANYNIYTGEYRISHEGINTAYTSIDDIGKMVLSVDGEHLAYNNSPILMLGNETVSKNSLSDYSNYLTQNHFVCKTKITSPTNN